MPNGALFRPRMAMIRGLPPIRRCPVSLVKSMRKWWTRQGSNLHQSIKSRNGRGESLQDQQWPRCQICGQEATATCHEALQNPLDSVVMFLADGNIFRRKAGKRSVLTRLYRLTGISLSYLLHCICACFQRDGKKSGGE